MLCQQDEGLVVLLAETLVDLLLPAGQTFLEVAVLVEFAARRGGDLDQREFPDQLGMFFQEAFHGVGAFENPFRVIEAVHPHGDDPVFRQVETLAQLGAARVDRRPRRFFCLIRPADGDRVAFDQRFLAVQRDDRVLVFDTGFQETVNCFDEVLAVIARVEPENAAAQHAAQQFLAPRADAEGFRVWPGDMPEGDDGGARQTLADELRQQGEVVILDEDDRIVGVRRGDDLLGEALVDHLVVVPIRDAEHRAHVGDVAERPQPFVGEPVVVAFLFLLAQPDPLERVRRMFGRDADHVVFIYNKTVGRAAAMCDPGSRTGAHDRLDGGDQSAGGALDGDAVGGLFVNIRFAVGDYEHLVATQIGVQQIAELLGCPQIWRVFAVAAFVLQFAQHRAQILSERLQLGGGRFERFERVLAAQQLAHAG